jgi:hypothetical protein
MPSLLVRHFETKHGDLKRKPLEYFHRKLSDLSASKGQVMSLSRVNMKAIEASYSISLRIAKAGKPHTVEEPLLLLAGRDMASAVLGERVAEQLESIPLSNDTAPRISDIASNVKEQIIEKVKTSKYYYNQLDENTDVSNVAGLVTFVICEDVESVQEQLLFCEPLLGRATSNDIFKN